jgi:hypothetical protein
MIGYSLPAQPFDFAAFETLSSFLYIYSSCSSLGLSWYFRSLYGDGLAGLTSPFVYGIPNSCTDGRFLRFRTKWTRAPDSFFPSFFLFFDFLCRICELVAGYVCYVCIVLTYSRFFFVFVFFSFWF